jgi:hypothetical protein
VRLSWWSRPSVLWIELVTCARFCFDASSGRSPPAPDAWTPFPAAAATVAVADGFGAVLSMGVGRMRREELAGAERRRRRKSPSEEGLGGATWARSRACPEILGGKAQQPMRRELPLRGRPTLQAFNKNRPPRGPCRTRKGRSLCTLRPTNPNGKRFFFPKIALFFLKVVRFKILQIHSLRSFLLILGYIFFYRSSPRQPLHNL